MFVGHALLAFALVGLVARRFGVTPSRALALAVVAALFATLPDVDVLYGPIGLLGGISGVGDAVTTFFATGEVTHRGPTHSVIVGALAAVGFALVRRASRPSRLAGGTLLVGLVGVTATTSGWLDASMVGAFVLGGIAIVGLARRLDLPARAVLVTAIIGLLSHPFGDLLTGSPPDLLYPLDVTVFPERLALTGDETLHLLGAFAVEIAIVWFALVVVFDLTDRNLGAAIDRRAAIGGVYGAAVFVLPAPTVDSASPFVFSVLSLGVVGVLPTRRTIHHSLPQVIATGLAAVTLAAATYAVAYVVI